MNGLVSLSDITHTINSPKQDNENMTDKKTKEKMRLAAVKSVKDREQKGQSPVPGHCICFDLRAEAREHGKPSRSRAVVTATVGDADDLIPFEVGDVPDTDEELDSLLSDEPGLEHTDQGWMSV